ncbi:PspC domain-containing protein [Bizionia sediminis]|uniref:PspC domain-containing protein n=1 Tax=Bizionia sediminis TaxID=1737064 RepID=A0ABW5KP83_9FLAO
MNKTININLAGIFFHIDEDAYLKLQGYLEAIKRSFAGEPGEDEILADIEARIAELFTERVTHDKQVIGLKEVDAIIVIMGQPEDYIVDDSMFTDAPNSQAKTATSKKLFRDTENSYIGGVAAGLGHYFGLDAVWIRLIWILLIFGAGTGVLLYILLWILIPEAKSTADKLSMKGEPITISNIEKKIKDGFDNVSDVAKNVSDTLSGTAKSVSDTVSDAAKHVNFKKKGQQVKSSSQKFFEAVGAVCLFCFNVIAKFIGVLLIIIGASTLISLLIGLLSVNVTDIVNIPGFELLDAANTANTPIWLASLLVFLSIGIPFFFIFYLGLKILVTNLKSIGNIAKFSLLGLWLIALISLAVIGIKHASEHAFDAQTVQQETLPVKALDTVFVKMAENHTYNKKMKRSSQAGRIAYTNTNKQIIYNRNIRFIVKATPDTTAYLTVEKQAEGSSLLLAKNRAENIRYDYSFSQNTLLLNPFLTTDIDNKFSNQLVEVTLYLPEQTVLVADNNTYSFHKNPGYYNDLLENGMEGHYLKITKNGIICLDCPATD